MYWPQNLIREVARRRCVLFLGAGVSASAEGGEKPQTWGDFLEGAKSLVRAEDVQEEIEAFLINNDFLLALQAIQKYADAGDYADYLRASFNNPAHKAGDLHKAIYRLDSRVVVTTNFDKIYESFCENTTDGGGGFSVVSYSDESLGDLIRTDARVIVKAHGSINNIPRMIFSRSQYHNAKKNHAGFYSILQSLLMTNTCLFVGCSMDDPDIKLLLEDVKIASSSTYPHYVLIRNGEHGKVKKDDWESSYNIKCLEYGSNYSELPSALSELVEEVEALRAINPEA